MCQFVDSLITFSAGVVLVLMSLDVIGWRSIEFMLVGLWPLLLIMVGLLLLGGALKSPLLTLLAGLCFVAFCVVGLLWYSVPGRAGFLGAVRARVSFRHAAVGKHRSKRVRCDLDNRMSVLVA